MPDNTVRILVPSTNRGRYALDDPQYGADLTSGMRVSVWLGGYWAKGSIEHDSRLGGYYAHRVGWLSLRIVLRHASAAFVGFVQSVLSLGLDYLSSAVEY